MRITHRSTTQSIKSQLTTRAERLETAWRHVSSGKRVERPSDDPAAVSRILSYRSLLSEVEQRRFQVEAGLSVLTTVDTVLDGVDRILMEAQKLALAGGGSVTPEDRGIMAGQVDELLAQLQHLAETKYDDRLLFATGALHTSAPDMAGLNLAADSVLGPPLAALAQLYSELSDGVRPEDETIADLQSALDHVVSHRTQVGARANRLESLGEQLLVMEQDLLARKSNDEEVDLSRAMIDLKEEETAYQAALAATSRLMRISLVDFLH